MILGKPNCAKKIFIGFLATLLCTSANADKSAFDTSRIVVTGGSITETLFYLGVENKIVGIDTTSNYPAAVKQLPNIGYVRNLSAEGLMSLSPSLILGEDDMGPPATLKQLAVLNVPIVTLPKARNGAEIIQNVNLLAEVTGSEKQAEAFINAKLTPLLRHLERELSRLNTGQGTTKPRVAVILSLGKGSPIIAGANTAGDDLLNMAGASNVFSFDGWQPVAREALLDARPDVLLLPNRAIRLGGGLDKLKASGLFEPGFTKIVVMDGMYLLGFGPRTLQAAVELAGLFHPTFKSPASLPFESKAAEID